jgi:hypothetical protein
MVAFLCSRRAFQRPHSSAASRSRAIAFSSARAPPVVNSATCRRRRARARRQRQQRPVMGRTRCRGRARPTSTPRPFVRCSPCSRRRCSRRRGSAAAARWARLRSAAAARALAGASMHPPPGRHDRKRRTRLESGQFLEPLRIALELAHPPFAPHSPRSSATAAQAELDHYEAARPQAQRSPSSSTAGSSTSGSSTSSMTDSAA